MKKHQITFVLVLFLVLIGTPVRAEQPLVTQSKDGTPISYQVFGKGETALVFVHGWSCDARYWREQVPYFSKKYQVVVLDLAGHGHSGTSRKNYTLPLFGEDVVAVAKAIDAKRVILIGHSMGGDVIAEAARLMPDRVIGLIGVDTLEDLEYPLTHPELNKLLAPLKKDFRTGSQQFVSSMLLPATDKKIREWILADISSAPEAIAMNAITNMLSRYFTQETAKTLEQVRVPLVLVNADQWPINYEANKRHTYSFDAFVLKKADHFLMLNQPQAFNRLLTKAIKLVIKKTQKG